MSLTAVVLICLEQGKRASSTKFIHVYGTGGIQVSTEVDGPVPLNLLRLFEHVL